MARRICELLAARLGEIVILVMHAAMGRGTRNGPIQNFV